MLLQDLVGEGLQALESAAAGYSGSAAAGGAGFGTYAAVAIARRMRRAAQEYARPMAVPPAKFALLQQVGWRSWSRLGLPAAAALAASTEGGERFSVANWACGGLCGLPRVCKQLGPPSALQERAVRQRLEAQLQRAPTREEVAGELGLPVSALQVCGRAGKCSAACQAAAVWLTRAWATL